jgi:glycosyltransferase involved in cell wall biosynthesis
MVKDLLACMGSVVTQSELPAEILIVDDGELDAPTLSILQTMVKDARGPVFRYYKKDHRHEPRGLSESKNIGLSLVKHPICFIFDDDVVLHTDFIRATMAVWQKKDNEHLLAVGGIISNNRRKSYWESFYNKLFCISSSYTWDVSATGYQVWDDYISVVTKGFYTHGGACSVHVGRSRQFPFRPFRGGRTALEDVTFYATAKQAGFHVYIEPEAKLVHNHTLAAREGQFKEGLKEGANRVYIMRLYGPSGFGFQVRKVWATCGWILRQFLVGHLGKACGMIYGILLGLISKES